MEYVNDINIIDAVIHILDSTSDEPILNNFKLELTDEVYKFLYKHLDKAFKSEDLKYAAFNQENRVVKNVAQEFLSGLRTEIIEVSQEFAKQMFYIMNANRSIPSCNLITVYISTDQGPMLGILKMDYVKNFTHNIDFIDEKLGIGIVEQSEGLPASTQSIQKCAFIRPIKENQEVDLMIIDKQKRTKDGEDFGARYFTNHYLGCEVIENERDMTKGFMKAAETWARINLTEDLGQAIDMRDSIKAKLREEETININEFSREVFKEDFEKQNSFNNYLESQGIERDIMIDKEFVEKKLKRIRLNIDREIDIYIDDADKFEVIKNGDGTINILIKRIKNYIEK
jgi:hypothetical protein